MRFLFLVLCLLWVPIAVLAQAISPVPVPSPSPAVLAYAAEATSWLNAHLIVAGSLAAAVIEFLVRFVPTDKPRSILILVSNVLHALGDLFTAASKFLDTFIQKFTPAGQQAQDQSQQPPKAS